LPLANAASDLHDDEACAKCLAELVTAAPARPEDDANRETRTAVARGRPIALSVSAGPDEAACVLPAFISLARLEASAASLTPFVIAIYKNSFSDTAKLPLFEKLY
jgi:hypothetical protein